MNIIRPDFVIRPDYDTTPTGYRGMTVFYETVSGTQLDACDNIEDGKRIAEGSPSWRVEDEEGEIVASSDDE